MSTPNDTLNATLKLSDIIDPGNQKELTDQINDLTERGVDRVHVDCSDLHLLTREHIWLLIQIQSQCQIHGITVILSAPTSTLFNIDTLGSLIEASSNLIMGILIP